MQQNRDNLISNCLISWIRLLIKTCEFLSENVIKWGLIYSKVHSFLVPVCIFWSKNTVKYPKNMKNVTVSSKRPSNDFFRGKSRKIWKTETKKVLILTDSLILDWALVIKSSQMIWKAAQTNQIRAANKKLDCFFKLRRFR